VADWTMPPYYFFHEFGDLPVEEIFRRWYERCFWISTLPDPDKPSPGWYGDACVEEARLGDPGPLIVYLQCGGELTPALTKLLVECLESKRKASRCEPKAREADKTLILKRYRELEREGKTKIVEHIAHKRKLSRRHVFEVMADEPRFSAALLKKCMAAFAKGDIAAADKLLDKLLPSKAVAKRGLNDR
jgi:hypothetical protein